MPSEQQRRDSSSSQWEQLDKKEVQLWRNSLLLLLVLAAALAISSWGAFRDLPRRLGALPVAIVVVVVLFGWYVWRKRQEIAELRGFVRGLQQGASAPPTEEQFAQLLELVSRSQFGYRELIDSLDQVVFTISLNGEIQVVNRRFVELLGLPFADVVHHALDEFLSEPSRAAAERGLAGFLERRSWSGLLRVRLKKSGELRYFNCMLHAVVHEDRVTGISGLASDVTAQRESEARFTELFETIQEGVVLSTPEGALLEVNPALVRMLGYDSRGELLQLRAQDLYANPAEREHLLREMEQKGSLRDREITLRRRDGTLVRCLASSTPIRDSAGGVIRIQGTLVDITGRLEMEKRLHREQEFTRRLVECFPDLIVVLDAQGRCTFVSPRVRELSGYAPEELLGRTLEELVHEDDRAALRNVFEDLISGQLASGLAEFRTRQKDGSWRIFRATASPLFDAGGEITGVVASTRDVSEAKQLEQQLLQTEKLAAMGQMLAGVAHELNNPLTAILGVSELLLEHAGDERTRRQTELIHQQARRAAGIVHNLLAFSRPPTSKRTSTQLDQVVQRALLLQEHSLERNHIAVDFVSDPSLPPVWADVNQLVQVFLNLIVNAEQAIHDIRDRGQIRLCFGHSEDRVWASVEDDGPGVPPEVQARIFDPFFTTKRPGGGTGLGLTICLSIIRELGGTIELETPSGGGAVFRVVLPPVAAKEKHPSLAPEARAAVVSSLRGHSILVVDDEEGIRELVQEGLSVRELTVDCAASAEEAFARLAERSYDAILCDFNLPGLSGEEFFGRLGNDQKAPAQRFVFMTGDLLDPQLVASFADHGARVVQKPFHIAELAAVLSEILAPAPTNAA